jgi:hypothetical protein
MRPSTGTVQAVCKVATVEIQLTYHTLAKQRTAGRTGGFFNDTHKLMSHDTIKVRTVATQDFAIRVADRCQLHAQQTVIADLCPRC